MDTSYVVISQAEKMNYQTDYTSLPKNYGTDAYYQRDDVKHIIDTVHDNLNRLNEKINFTAKIKNKKVIIKPNLVGVWHNTGFEKPDYPETTDPRVIDSVVLFLKKYTDNMVITESSGRGMPTRFSFKNSGLDRLAKHHNLPPCIALEEQPAHLYLLPKAKVMKEVFLPEPFNEIVDGDAFYISIPKMKTNLYTGVTLGFKNAMGIMTYNNRQRNHTAMIDQKLVDMLHLFQADLTIIDGIIGGEGPCPAPVDPVESHVIISGDNSVETDRVTTRVMGYDPDDIPLMRIAAADDFGCPDVEIIGEEIRVPFRKPNRSLMSDEAARTFPNVRVLVGNQKGFTPKVKSLETVTPAVARKIEQGCPGGCLPTVIFGLESIRAEGHDTNFRLTIVLGSGILLDGKRYFFDKTGKPYTVDDIIKLDDPVVAVGSCTRELKGLTDHYVDGCMPMPMLPHNVFHKAIKTSCRVLNPKNKQFYQIAWAALGMERARRKIIKSGRRIDCDPHWDDYPIPKLDLTEEDQRKDFIKTDLPPLTKKEIKKALHDEFKAFIAPLL